MKRVLFHEFIVPEKYRNHFSQLDSPQFFKLGIE